ncbi:chaperonin 10-like protein [Pseudoneurospora amorphoporcata]|uniref:Chaperonin 10-like protein n=1 Tax=Pseudoneurospora amorphoporcata TaxID=241081 RepID=A0AAN6SDV7_9PEZI|nr:chaperonin 10-like protein [Pseudoneurospora amorphoporcata]
MITPSEIPNMRGVEVWFEPKTTATTTASLPAGIPPTHPAVVITAPRAPLSILYRPTEAPGPGEALVHVEWTTSTPLDLHHADGGLLIDPPHVGGSSFGGTVIALGPAPSDASVAAAHNKLSVGDQVFSMAWREPREHGFHDVHHGAVLPDEMSKLPEGTRMHEAVTVSTNLVTVLHTLTKDLELEMPRKKDKKQWILVWGAASSRHHQELLTLGAAAYFDYSQGDVTDLIRSHVATAAASSSSSSDNNATIPLVLDYIGSLEGSLRPPTRLAEKGTKVAVMLSVINKHTTNNKPPEGSEFMKNHAQPDIVPALLEQGVVKPNKQSTVEGATLLERATNALKILRDRAQSGEKLEWRVDEKSAHELFPDLFVPKADPTKAETII